MTKSKGKMAVLMIGCPGAGKSYVAKKIIKEDIEKGIEYTVINPDLEKERKTDYDPKNPQVHHEWSKEESNKKLLKGVQEGKNLLIDKTGTNVYKYSSLINTLKFKGYYTKLVYVKVPLLVALERNKKRSRTVPENIVVDKYCSTDDAFKILSAFVDEELTIMNG